MNLSFEHGRYYVIFHYPHESIPAALKELIEEISYYETFRNSPIRQFGIYKRFGATAKLDIGFTGKTQEYKLKIYGTNSMKSVEKLYQAIRADKIVPWQSWQDVQTTTRFRFSQFYPENLFPALTELCSQWKNWWMPKWNKFLGKA